MIESYWFTTVRFQVQSCLAISTDKESFVIPAAPDLIPDGPWEKVEGGVCAAKGFKATGKESLVLGGWLCGRHPERTLRQGEGQGPHSWQARSRPFSKTS